ncbi:MAG TPA: ABC transporter permease [Nocardioidaceae bacterium]|nr:ABC transporter permease [Nocardioidaceae bacterium]
MSTAPALLGLSPRARRRRRMRRRFTARKAAVIGGALSLFFVLVAVFAPLLAPYGAAESDFEMVLYSPSPTHPFGTDELGRDILSRVIIGARASMTAGALATLLAIVVAVPIGLVAGYYRGAVDMVIMRINDALLAFPFLVLAVGLAAILGPSLVNAALAIGLSAVPNLVRITRAEVMGLREEDYVDGAIANGANDLVILRRHILPNVVNTLLVQATVLIPAAIIAESLLSFLGLGVQPPAPSWGVMLSAAQPYIAQAPWLALYPGIAIFVATLSFNLFGDGLRDVLDPKALG